MPSSSPPVPGTFKAPKPVAKMTSLGSPSSSAAASSHATHPQFSTAAGVSDGSCLSRAPYSQSDPDSAAVNQSGARATTACLPTSPKMPGATAEASAESLSVTGATSTLADSNCRQSTQMPSSTLSGAAESSEPQACSFFQQQAPQQQQTPQQQHSLQQPPQLMQQERILASMGGVCCVAPWATDVVRSSPLFLPQRPVVAAGKEKSDAAAAALPVSGEAPLLRCEKKIHSTQDLSLWINSSSYSHYTGFLKKLSLAVVGKPAFRVVPPLPAAAAAAKTIAAVGAETSETTVPQMSSDKSGSSSSRSSCKDDVCVVEQPQQKLDSKENKSYNSSTAGGKQCSDKTTTENQQKLTIGGFPLPAASAAAFQGQARDSFTTAASAATAQAEAKRRAAALATAASAAGIQVSDATLLLVEALQLLLLWVEEIKPVEQPMRFGNKAFRIWLQRLSCCCRKMLLPVIPAAARPPPAALRCDTIIEDPIKEAEAAGSPSPPLIRPAAGVAETAAAEAAASLSRTYGGLASIEEATEAAAAAPAVPSSPALAGSTIAETVTDAASEEAAATAVLTDKAASAMPALSSGSGSSSVGAERAAAETEQVTNSSSSTTSLLQSSCSKSFECRSDEPQQQQQEEAEESEELGWRRKKGKRESRVLSVVGEELLEELIDLFCHSFGDAKRLDYGTGHEVAFAFFLLLLFESHTLREGVDDAAAVLLIFTQYIEVCHALQRRYSLEPAGSRGAWGLDDFHFLPFFFGAAQLLDQALTLPSHVTDASVVQELAPSNLYFSSIEYIMQTKRGAPFSECAPMLYDISGVSSWKKIYTGLLRMYEGEVLNKFPIAQHFLFGRYLPLHNITTPL